MKIVSQAAAITLGPAVKDTANAARVEEALGRVPKPGNLVTSARIAEDGGKLRLVLALKEPVDDIFVESRTSAYFAAPVFSDGGLEARLPIANVGDAAKLKGKPLTLTYLTGGKGLEQALTLP